MSFQSRLTVLVGAAVALGIAAAAAVMFLVVRAQLNGQLDGQLADRARQIAGVAATIAERCPDLKPGTAAPSVAPSVAPSAAVAQGSPPAAGSSSGPSPNPLCPTIGTLPPPRPGDSAGVVQFVAPSGVSIRLTDQGTILPVNPGAAALARASASGDLFEDVVVAGVPMRLLTHALSVGGAVQVALPRDSVEQVLANLRWILLGISIVGVAVAAALGRTIARSALGPVARLTVATERVTGTRNLSERVDEPGHDELGRLARSFNRMLSALDESERSRRQLVADASHELRTPLTSLRTNIEVLARSPALEAGDRQELLDSLIEETERLSHLVADLIELARGDEGIEPTLTDIRLDELAEAAIDVARHHYPSVRFSLRSEPATVMGDPRRVRRAIDNLLDNAGKWSPSGATVDIEVTAHELSVRDHGPGIEPADRQRVFDRFWRASGSRTTPGFGLGLAIVAQTARSHGGDVRLEMPPDGGSRFILRLPAGPRNPTG
jgi:two-component system sensor histidine kinase MprB